ncbi:DUF892 family protein [Hyphomicrobium sp.]|uniref:DUF892 family protein n=1 Tax=Hyphomicrobium sp. TaxID=82 RepID=UPI0025BF6EE1|nr:DUF892 family protein [Hyphomicrobium sp.]
MIAAAQAVEHHEITHYGTLVSWGAAARSSRGGKAALHVAQGGAWGRQQAQQAGALRGAAGRSSKS